LHLNKWQRLPDFELSAFTAKDLHGQNQGLGLSFNIPLWNFNSAEIARSQRLLESQQQELTSIEIAVTTDIKNRYARLLLAEKTINLFQKGLLKQAGESERIARFSYQQGESSLIDYLDSQRTYLQIQKDYVQALLTWSLEKAGLEMAAGETIT
jgi:cobalt-zinc-cadmium efflux system outer membrane protein